MLPAIVETNAPKDRSKTPSPSKTPDSYGSKGSAGNPFRPVNRRPTVSSPTRSMASPTRATPPKNLSHQDGISAHDGRKPLTRRESGSGLVPPTRRPSLGTIGSRVNSLLKAKNAFNRLKSRRRSKTPGEIDEDITEESFEIKELPKEARFGSTLSTEAQYAMLKGYEDVVYRNLCNQFPEQVHLLRRNKTPVAGISVKTTERIDSRLQSITDEADSPRKNEAYIEHVRSANRPRVSVSTEDSMLAQTPDHGTARVTPTFTYSVTSALPGQSEVKGAHNPDAQDANKGTSFPKIAQKQEKQKLVMTHRYQSVMDMLDILRENQGLHRLSPRVPSVEHMEPVKEYNTWAYVWSREFESKQNAEVPKRKVMRYH